MNIEKPASFRYKLRFLKMKIMNLRTYDQREIHQVWEVHALRKALDYAKVDCVFAIGANAGQYASMLRTKVGYRGRIISFEPLPHLASSIRKSSSLDPMWTVEELAVSDHDGHVEFNQMENSEFSSILEPSTENVQLFAQMNSVKNTFSVKAETLTTAFKRLKDKHKFSTPFLKMDTQGHDLTIFRAAGDTVLEFSGLQSELAFQSIYKKSPNAYETIAEYSSRGFTLSALVPNNEGHFPRLIESDCIMMRL